MEAFFTKNIIAIVLILEAVVGVFILNFVPCNRNVYHTLSLIDTEIDWVAYMQQIETYLSGDKDYNHYMVFTDFYEFM